jgi:hypothetical protein
MKPLAALLAGAIACVGAGADPAEVLHRVTAKVRSRGARLPNYTCVETVRRDYYVPRAATLEQPCDKVLEERRHPGLAMALRPLLSDRLRLDVTMTTGGEIYSWVGASKFEDADISQVVHQGPIATGEFGALLKILFRRDAETFHFEKSLAAGGRNLLEYSFSVPEDDSGYVVKAGDGWVHTAFHGTFQADPETDEVVRVTVETAPLPPATGACQTSTTMDLGLVAIGDGRFLLPKEGRQRFVGMTGSETENTTTFANCREFRGESTLSFSQKPDPAAGAVPKSGAPPARVPAGLPFTFELTTPIATATAAGGDPFSGRLVGALRDKKGEVVAPARSPVEGRLLRVEMVEVKPTGTVMVLQLRTVESGGVKLTLAADRDWVRMQRESRIRIPVLLPFTWEKDTGVFQLPEGDKVAMKAGTRSEWVTK